MSAREHLSQIYTETYPEIDAIVKEYIHQNEFQLRSSEEAGFILLSEKEERVVQYHDLPTLEMTVLDNEGKATFIIHKLMYSEFFKRGVLLFIPFLIIIAIAIFVFMSVGVGIDLSGNYAAMIVYVVACTGLSIIPLTTILKQERRRVDLAVHALRHNLVDVLEIIAEVQVSERQRNSYLERAQMLKS